VFVIRESDGLADVLEPEPHPTLWDCVRRAEDACPEDAIVIEEDEDKHLGLCPKVGAPSASA
jgi:hypothetical protein